MATKNKAVQATDPRRWPSLKLFCAILASIALLGVMLSRGCRTYPPATSLESYTLMEALYTACNTKNAGSLNKIEQRVNRAKEERSLSAAECDAFARIIAMGRNGQWREATREAFRFSQDQVGRGRLFDNPENHAYPRASATAPR